MLRLHPISTPRPHSCPTRRSSDLAQRGAMPSAALLASAEQALMQRFDRQWGGFGGAPKFPHSSDLELLLSSDQPAHRAAALHSLMRMAEGGINDQLAGGFSRYSVDARWEIPHFEKMLYDSALLLPLYARAAALSGESHYRSEEHTSELQSLMRISYAVFCFKKKN